MIMVLTSKYNFKTMWWIGTLLLCANLTACSSDSIIEQTENNEGDTPMQFSQAALNAPVTRATRAAEPLSHGFLVSSWKGFGTSNQQVVMDKYQVNIYVDNWNNNTKWDYVSSESRSFYQTQIMRYWDFASMPYRFYAITPCPPDDQISQFTLSANQLIIPNTVTFKSETCVNGIVTKGEEPYMPAQIRCTSESNNSDYDLLNGDKNINKSGNGATTTLSRYVALPFHHFTTKVRFALYSTYESNDPAELQLRNIVIKVKRDGGFVTSANGYSADLSQKTMIEGEFTNPTTESGDYTLLTDAGTDKFAEYDEESKAYWCQCEDGILQIPQDKVELMISFTLKDDGFVKEYIKETNQVKYDETTHTLTYTDIPVTAYVDNQEVSRFTWKSNYIYTYKMKITEFYPIRIECTATLTPWTEVYGSIDTNLEQ